MFSQNFTGTPMIRRPPFVTSLDSDCYGLRIPTYCGDDLSYTPPSMLAWCNLVPSSFVTRCRSRCRTPERSRAICDDYQQPFLKRLIITPITSVMCLAILTHRLTVLHPLHTVWSKLTIHGLPRHYSSIFCNLCNAIQHNWTFCIRSASPFRAFITHLCTVCNLVLVDYCKINLP